MTGSGTVPVSLTAHPPDRHPHPGMLRLTHAHRGGNPPYRPHSPFTPLSARPAIRNSLNSNKN